MGVAASVRGNSSPGRWDREEIVTEKRKKKKKAIKENLKITLVFLGRQMVFWFLDLWCSEDRVGRHSNIGYNMALAIA